MQTQATKTSKPKLTQAQLVVGAKVQPRNEPNKIYTLLRQYTDGPNGLWEFTSSTGWGPMLESNRNLLAKWQLA
jgi:hypothetical protein